MIDTNCPVLGSFGDQQCPQLETKGGRKVATTLSALLNKTCLDPIRRILSEALLFGRWHCIDFAKAGDQRCGMPKKAKKTPAKPKKKPAPFKPSKPKPKPKTGKTLSVAGGFTRISETRIRKVYR